MTSADTAFLVSTPQWFYRTKLRRPPLRTGELSTLLADRRLNGLLEFGQKVPNRDDE